MSKLEELNLKKIRVSIGGNKVDKRMTPSEFLDKFKYGGQCHEFRLLSEGDKMLLYDYILAEADEVISIRDKALYNDKLIELVDWFDIRIKYMEPFEITQSDYSYGVDSLKGKYLELKSEAYSEFLKNGYELSYNQICNALFYSANRNKKMIFKG